MSPLDEKKAVRFKLLKALYDATAGGRIKSLPLSDLSEAAGLTYEQADHASDYLSDEGLLEFTAFGPLVAITHQGAKEVERALEHPERPTKHFLPVQVICVGTMIGSTIQASHSQSGDNINVGGNVTGSAVGSNASLTARDIVTQIQQSGLLGEDIKNAFAAAAEALDALKAPDGTKEDVADDLEKLKKELEKPTKDEGRIKTIWERINSVASTVASALAAAATIGKILTGNP